eukprot:m.287557 g.287557  ORF g.287557 m.287557 type:complete len:348 (-) comp11801_c0_seq1:120-1163(-)
MSYSSEQDRTEAARIERILAHRRQPQTTSRDFNISQVVSMTPPWLAKALEALAPLFALLLRILDTAGPHIIRGFATLSALYQRMPANALTALYGFAMCLFGGKYAASIAAVEAFKMCGWDRTHACLMDLMQDVRAMHSAHLADDKRDDNMDGIPDVELLNTKEKLHRKLALYLRVINPDRVIGALGGIYQGVIGVVSTLKFHFARVVTLGVSIGNYLRKPAAMYVAPGLAHVVPAQHQKWVPMIVSYLCKMVGITSAYAVQHVLSVAQSAFQGGVMCSRALFRLAEERGIYKINEDESMLDEFVGYAFAALGVYLQLWAGFSLFFPLNLILLPLNFVEWLLWLLISW